MIERAITEKDHYSRFYKHNERLAKSWEEFATQYSAKIDGIVNGSILEFTTVFCFQEKQVTIKAIRQHSNNKAGPHYNYVITKNTIIKIEPLKLKEQYWRIRKHSTLLEMFLKLNNHCAPFYFDNSYSIISKSRVNERMLFNSGFWEFLSSLSEIRRISYKNELFEIEYFNFLGPRNVKALLNYTLEKYRV
ncbi:hypothetical protein [Draconibacterium sediminis]|uniref:Uncharacterized protein n=1 Tax=Draconibacterium sediminis TaxID=1544798 RepID=A0A0D8J8F0_9BACT|nr:hypothetical protein [Draconibacterium sediminis]KJF43240.1 hypothetical protein LH29_13370 [Draconibacterium sediminis]